MVFAADLIPGLAIPDRGVPRRLRVERELHEELVSAVGSLRDPRIAVATITRARSAQRAEPRRSTPRAQKAIDHIHMII